MGERAGSLGKVKGVAGGLTRKDYRLVNWRSGELAGKFWDCDSRMGEVKIPGKAWKGVKKI